MQKKYASLYVNQSIPAEVSLILPCYQPFVDAEILHLVSIHTVELIIRALHLSVVDEVKIALALSIDSVIHSHVGIDLDHLSQQVLNIDRLSNLDSNNPKFSLLFDALHRLPDSATKWQPLFNLYPSLIATISDDHNPRESDPPFLFDHPFLLTKRYFIYNDIIKTFILNRVNSDLFQLDISLLKQDIQNLFGELNPANNQILGTISALFSSFAVICGGPGTGKTFTVTKILSCFFNQFFLHHQQPPSILIAAPTGKAAVRLQEVLRDAIQANNKISPAQRSLFEITPSTIHSMLGYNPKTPTRFRHNRQNPLSADLIIVDEASMIDLSLMAHLMDAIAPNTRLILLGDMNQLASVEAGTVLADITDDPSADSFTSNMLSRFKAVLGTKNIQTPTVENKFSDHIVHFRKPYRTKENSGIQTVAYAIINNHPQNAVAWLRGETIDGLGPFPDLSLHHHGRNHAIPEQILTTIIDEITGPDGYISRLLEPPKAGETIEEKHAEVLTLQKKIGILTPYRQTSFGEQELNRLIEARVLKAMASSKNAPYFNKLRHASNQPEYWVGVPILITENVVSLGLMNGDIGIVVPGNDNDHAQRVAFPGPTPGSVRYLSLAQLPKNARFFAMTVHKSQGSEFSHVVFVLPDTCGALLTRELIYTAVTRAKEKLSIIGTSEILEKAINKRIFRCSNLHNHLWK